MSQNLIFAPMGALVFLTFTILLLIQLRRFRVGVAGQVQTDDFKFGESPAMPGEVAIPNRNLMNLLELPLLFYVAALMYYVTGKVDSTVLGIAWTYVALRAIHSLIHVTYNKAAHRLIVFTLSNIVLGAFWVGFFVR